MTRPPSNQAHAKTHQPTLQTDTPEHYVVDEGELSTATRVAHAYRPICIERLKRHGFSQAEAEKWTPLDSNAFWTRSDLVQTACAFRDAGYDSARARDWTRLDATVTEANDYEAAGWTPNDVQNLLRTLHRMRHPRRSHCPTRPECEADESVWIATGIPAPLVPLYIRAGHTPTIALAIDARRRNGDTTIVQALTVMAALRHPEKPDPGRPNVGGPSVPFPGPTTHEVQP